MRAAVLAVGLVVVACGGTEYIALPEHRPSELTAASWSVEDGAVVCQDATRRFEWDNASDEVPEPGTGDLVVCIWSCAIYDAAFGGRQVTADHHSLHLEFLRTESGWVAIQQSAGQGSCLHHERIHPRLGR
jgi:hypothetical protein